MPAGPLNVDIRSYGAGPYCPSTVTYALKKTGSNLGPNKGKWPTFYEMIRSRRFQAQSYSSNGRPFCMDARISLPYGLHGLHNDSRFGPLRNRAYAKLVDKVMGPRSSLGAALAEWRSSLDMITSRALQARDLYRAFRGRNPRLRNDVSIFARRTRRRGRALTRSESEALRAAETWLEFWFGWSPLLGDITSSCQVMSKPLPSGESVEGSASFTTQEVLVSAGSTYTKTFKLRSRTGCKVRLENPNLFLANSLGLVNPALVTWEIIPMSFVADWMFDVSGFLESFSDFVGLDVTDAWNSTFYDGLMAKSGGAGLTGTFLTRQTYFKREVGLIRPQPNLEVVANLGDSLTRAATAVSLITTLGYGQNQGRVR